MRVFICSPYSGASQRAVAVNVNLARKLCRAALLAGHAPFAPHLIYPTELDDGKHEDRVTGITAGLKFLDVCDEVWVYSDCYADCTDGMKRELLHAEENGKRIIYMPPEWNDLWG